MATYTLDNKLDFLRHNNRSVKRDKKIKEIKIKGIHIFLIIFLFSSIATGVFFFAKFIMTWEKLNINTFILENSEKINPIAINKILKTYRGNILAVDLGKMRQDLMKINQIKDVSINRILPSGIKISFLKRKPILQFEINGRWCIIDDEGIILERGYEVEKGLLRVREVSKDNIKSLIPYINELNSIKHLIDYVSIKKPYGILLKLRERNITVFPGISDFNKKIGYYLKLKKRDILKRLKVKSIDMRFENRIYLEYDKETANG